MTSFQPTKSWLFNVLSAARRNSSRQRRRRAIESLEPRMMLTADVAFHPGDLSDDVHVLFGPGTSTEYIAQVERVQQPHSVSRVTCAGSGMFALDGMEAVTTDLAEYQATKRWENTTTDGVGLSWGDATAITWSIVPDGTSIPGYVGEAAGESNFISFMSGIDGSAEGTVTEQAWFSMVASVFDRWSEISGLNFVYEPHDDGAAFSNIASGAPGVAGVRGDIRIGGHAIDGTSGTLAYNFFPDNGEMILDTSDSFFFNTASNWLRLRNVMAHEVGHGIGLSHVDPIDGTKLMESIASTAFDGPQHDDILAAHRLYGDEFETGSGNDRFGNAVDLGVIDGRSVTIGDNAAEQYVSIDGATDVDYYRFTASAGTLLDARLIPLGQVYQQGAVGAATSNFQSQSQNDLGVKIYDINHQLIGRADSRGLGDTETAAGVTLVDGGQYFVEVHGTRDTAQLYQLDLTVSAGVADDSIDFRDYTVDTYGGSQDHSGSVLIENNGAALHLTGNRWKKIDFPYTVTSHTVLEFDFASTAQGEVHGIGFDSNTSISSGLTFRVYGTQDWGRDEFAVYNASSGVYHFVIPVGQSYTGQATTLVFVNDHDVANPHAESIFSNVRIYERERGASNVAAPQVMNDHIVLYEDSATVAFDALANDDGGGAPTSITSVSSGSAGGAVSVASDGRIHYRPVTDFNGTETFTYTAANAGGASTGTVTVTVRPLNDPPTASDNRYSVSPGHTYRLDVLNNDSTGVDVGEELTIVSLGKGSADGTIVTDGSHIIYTPAANFVGTETFTYTINDGTAGSNATARVTVGVRLSESDSLDLRDYQIDAYGGRQDFVGAALVEDAGRVVRLVGNTWKKIDVPYTITPDTMIEFDFSSSSQGDIHGIGFDSNNTITSSRTVRLYGTQNWGIDEFANYTSNDGSKHYAIRIGEYYTGPVAHLFFVNDHDVRNPTAESVFSDIRLYESPQDTSASASSLLDSSVTDSALLERFLGTLALATGDSLIDRAENTRPISSRPPAAILNRLSIDSAWYASTCTIHRFASAAGRTASVSPAGPDPLGSHSLDLGTITALDQIFASLADDA